jgi:hypothetical protein
MNTKQLQIGVAESILGILGRMIYFSKSGYMDLYPRNLVVFNANVCTQESKIWYGDLDITNDIDKLQRLSTELDMTIYVLYEIDGGFENENHPLLDRYIAKFHIDGTYELNDEIKKLYEL